LTVGDSKADQNITMGTRIPLIDTSRCTGCGACIGACAPGVLAFEHRGWRKLTVLQDEAPCTGCAKCQVRCWTHAIRMVQPSAASHPHNVALISV
jgi:NAD-dependent dihydropyrimidine dehydrogenase PreA subunit